ncbi:uncharacterized protein LOC122367719 [Amphibalanus amphitrite]|uniref:uncharacterized protein LOC122367719 n=1 Tax=Amphibalanus amphitrite TaxID=1232801 RepID=UPI001C921A56|nr:uncharacterized protein LOC122367719 [Amphibalanus amphitrite]
METWFPVHRRCLLVHWTLVCLLVWLAPYLVAAQRSDHDTALLDPLPAPVSARMVRARPVQGGNSLQSTAEPGGAGVGERAVENPLEDPLQQLNLEEGSGGGEQDTEEVVSQQFEGPRREPGVLECDFGSGDRGVSLCDYSNSNITVLRWQASTGRSSNWLGGPPTDATGSQDGGYVFFETSELPDDDVLRVNSESAMLESGLQPRTPPAGQCVQ